MGGIWFKLSNSRPVRGPGLQFLAIFEGAGHMIGQGQIKRDIPAQVIRIDDDGEYFLIFIL